LVCSTRARATGFADGLDLINQRGGADITVDFVVLGVVPCDDAANIGDNLCNVGGACLMNTHSKGNVGELQQLFGRKAKIAGDSVVAGVTPGGDAAWRRIDRAAARGGPHGRLRYRDRQEYETYCDFSVSTHGACCAPVATRALPLMVMVLPLASRPAAMPPSWAQTIFGPSGADASCGHK
jgi:hypothetical protein